MRSSEVVAVVAVLCGQSRELQELRHQVSDLLISAELKRELKVRHRLTASCLGVPHLSAWTLLYTYGTDENLLNVTTLTREAFNELLARFAGCYTIHKPGRVGGRPPS
ncbi:putative DDE Tnp4 domain-containing protein [Phytophthora infestans]|uniref:Putative DDE Tnp4 domain-containing protein n=1 Tax=Phytophthora infestans TaxID=4787 RepID=A0A833S7S1_PHYIN|nr:putative DDE Tnp4 domain-containing protein [Phytophthora infestans]